MLSPSALSLSPYIHQLDAASADTFATAHLAMARRPSLPTTAPSSPTHFPADKQVDALELPKLENAFKAIHRGSIDQNLRSALSDIDVDECDVDGENAFFVADLSEVYRQHLRWIRQLPRVVPFYAVKCNPDPYVLRLLAALGTGFDCASNAEIQTVLDIGVSPSRIIYANPCKASSFVRQAAVQGVGLATFDNADELRKMARFHPGCKLVVRILADDSKSACPFGLKFGASLDTVPSLLSTAVELGLDVVGVSFHVGSGCYDPDSFRDAVHRARQAFDMGKEAGFCFDFLDLGGGYDYETFEGIAKVLSSAIDVYFPDADFAPGGRAVQGKPNGLRIIAEPGRYYVQRAFVLAANIIARRDRRTADLVKDTANMLISSEVVDDVLSDVPSEEEKITDMVASSAPIVATSIRPTEIKAEVMYYQNDGVYGAFNCIMFDHQVVHPKVLTLARQYKYRPALPPPGVDPLDSDAPSDDLTLQPCSIWGPTCDSIDCIRSLADLPKGLSVGDWLVYENMGAYTICAASAFNGIRCSEVRYTVGEDGPDALDVEAALRSR